MVYKKQTQDYFKEIEKQVHDIYGVAEKAREKGYDPVNNVEIPLAMNMSEKVVGLISVLYPQLKDSGVAKRINELEKKYGKLDTTVTFKIAEEVAKQKFCKFESLRDAIDCGIRVGFAYQTIAVVASPIEGYTNLKIEKTRNGKEYFKVYFSGPIRSAGTTATCVILMVIDYLREIFGYEKYDPNEEEIKRYFIENQDYHERVTNLQYFPLEEEANFLAKNLPIQIAGEPTEKIEVSNYKNLERVETNFIRGGMCLTFSEGLAQKAAKGFRLYNKSKKDGVKMGGFDFLEDYLKLHEKLTSFSDKKQGDNVPTYMKDLVAGRPIFGNPKKSGAFRFRYGRCKVSGFSASSLHPATMAISNNFIATGTQFKIERPTKGTAITPSDFIEGPIVKLDNGSVRKIKTKAEAEKIYKNVDEIIYFGDILFPFSDVSNRNAELIKSGYVEEWWFLELKEKIEYLKSNNLFNKQDSLLNLDYYDVNIEKAIKLSKDYEISLHPSFIYYWNEIEKQEFLELIKWLKKSKVDDKIILPYNSLEKEKFSKAKRALELIGLEHEVSIENIIINQKDSKGLFVNIGLNINILDSKKETMLNDLIDIEKIKLMFEKDLSVIDVINELSEFEIRDKSGEFIGSRMGRPEKAKLRKLIGSPNILFPVSNEGGRLRSVKSALDIGSVKSDFPLRYCKKCKKESIFNICSDCGEKCEKLYYFRDIDKKDFKNKIKESEREGVSFSKRSVEIGDYFEKAVKNLGFKKEDVPDLIKGVRGTFSDEHTIENFEKGILRAKYNLQVNKDGTIRFDATELPLTHFKPKEIFVGVEKLKEMGYINDIDGKELISDEQTLELKPHDVLLPCPHNTLDENAGDVFVKISQFVDDELTKFYKMNPFYNVKNKEDLVGKLGVCMAPHNCAGVICRFIGFSETQGLFASPYMHAAIRRDCDGDEAALMLLGDVLINFSKKFLPSHRGGTQDAPLVLNAHIDAGEVDDQILDFEITPDGFYPLELYKLAEKKEHSSKVDVYSVKKLLKENKDPFVNIGFTHDVSNFNNGVSCSSYKLFSTMKEKVQNQMELVERIRAVNNASTARLMIERHFIRDMRGNLRKFSVQGFRCVACNNIMRRPPLSGVCPVCKGKIIFTIHEGGIKKYLEPALDLAKKYDLPKYVQQNLELIKRYIESIFGREKEKQVQLKDYF